MLFAPKRNFLLLYIVCTQIDKEGRPIDDLLGVVFPSFFIYIIVNASLIKLQIHKKKSKIILKEKESN